MLDTIDSWSRVLTEHRQSVLKEYGQSVLIEYSQSVLTEYSQSVLTEYSQSVLRYRFVSSNHSLILLHYVVMISQDGSLYAVLYNMLGICSDEE